MFAAVITLPCDFVRAPFNFCHDSCKMVFARANLSANLSHPEFPLTPGIFILKSHPGVVGSSQFDWSLTHTGNDCEKAQRQTLVIRWPCVLFSVSCLPNAPNPHVILFALYYTSSCFFVNYCVFFIAFCFLHFICLLFYSFHCLFLFGWL